MRHTSLLLAHCVAIASTASCQCGHARVSNDGSGDQQQTECVTRVREVPAPEVCISGGVWTLGHAKLPKPLVDEAVAFAPMPFNDWAPEHKVTLAAFWI